MQDKAFRKPHLLTPNVGNKVPSNLIFVDTEAAIFQDVRTAGVQEQTLSFGIVRHIELARIKIKTDNTTRFETARQFWDFVYRRCDGKKLLYIFAHNTRYDMQLLDLAGEIESKRITVDFAVTERGCYILKGETQKGPIVILDTMNYWNVSLSKLGEMVGRPKTPMPDVLDGIEPWIAYCINDVDIIQKAIVGLLQWIKIDDLGNFKFTAASQSFAAFRHNFMDVPILIHGHRKSVDLERKSFRAGRCSLFRYGEVKEKIYHVDVNSLYAYIMADKAFPCRLIGHDVMVSPNDERVQDDLIGKIARVVVRSEEHEYPYYTKNGVKYCTGQFTTILSGPEFAQALAHGEIVSIGECCFYECKRIFAHYMQFLLERRKLFRQSGLKIRESLCKTFANALFGKFGQRCYDWADNSAEWSFEGEDSWTIVTDDKPNGTSYRKVGGVVQMQLTGEESVDSFPAIASYVTSYGRLYMDVLREVAGPRSVMLQYVDSLHLTASGFNNLSNALLIDDFEPGKLKIEKVYDSGIYHSAHDYEVDKKHVICGIPTRAIEIENGVFLFDQFDCGEPILRSEKPATVTVRRIEREMQRHPPDSEPDADGWMKPVDAGGF